MKSTNNQKANTNRKAYFAAIFGAVLCLMTSGCFSIEQEIFLKPDGSGDMVITLSMPDPELMKMNAPTPQQDPLKLFDEFKQKFANDLPPAIKLKEAKELRRHGVTAFYIVLHFNQLNDVNPINDKFAKEAPEEFLKEFWGELLDEKRPLQSTAHKVESFWKIQLEKTGDLTMITQRIFYADTGGAMAGKTKTGKQESAKPPSDSPAPDKSQTSVTPKSGSKPARKAPTRRTARGAKPVAPKEDSTIESEVDAQLTEFGEAMGMVISSAFKLRFVLHAPKKITETNADIVLDEKTAVWNASFAVFLKEKKPVEMKVIY
jgi:hypothetical protein